MSVLYHYCKSEVFRSIVETRSFRLSAVRHSNDHTEGRMVSQAVARLAVKNSLSEETEKHLQWSIANLENLFEGLAFCLSHEPDLLSQWRGYADDGRGVAIGFSRDYLEWLEDTKPSDEPLVQLYEVKYKTAEHDALVEPVFSELRRLLESKDQFVADIPSGADPESNDYKRLVELHGRLAALTLLHAAMPSLEHVYLLKHSAFAEEREVRLLHRLGDIPSEQCSYHVKADALVPFRVRTLPTGPVEPISTVVLGPKHRTPKLVVENFLLRNGFANVDVSLSSAPYR